MESTEDSSLTESVDDVDACKENEFIVRNDVNIDDETISYNELIYADEITVEEENKYEEIEDSSEICMTFEQNLLSPISSSYGKSPHHSISDCGYESHGSPTPDDPILSTTSGIYDIDLLSDLFPSLA
jgi:hypothetical protein